MTVGSAVLARRDPFSGTAGHHEWNSTWQLRNTGASAGQPNAPGQTVTADTHEQWWVRIDFHNNPFYQYGYDAIGADSYAGDAGRIVRGEVDPDGDLLVALGGHFLQNSSIGTIGGGIGFHEFTYTIAVRPGLENIPEVSGSLAGPSPAYHCIVGNAVIYVHNEMIAPPAAGTQQIVRAYHRRTLEPMWDYVVSGAGGGLQKALGYNSDVILCIGTSLVRYVVLNSETGVVKASTQPFSGFNIPYAAGLGSIFLNQFAGNVRRAF
jgi:hypothetical protein